MAAYNHYWENPPIVVAAGIGLSVLDTVTISARLAQAIMDGQSN
jgi:hypothetical protein